VQKCSTSFSEIAVKKPLSIKGQRLFAERVRMESADERLEWLKQD
jgi:hypothetical protein